MPHLGKLIPLERSGEEPFTLNGSPTGKTLLDFWKWAASDLVDTAIRSRVAEFLVACDLGVEEGLDHLQVQSDFVTPDGISIRVRSASYCQSWEQKNHSQIMFNIRPRSRSEDDEDNEGPDQKTIRPVDVYVFCLLKHLDKETLDPLKVDQWEFLVLSSLVLDEYVGERKLISLTRLIQLEPERPGYGEIRKAIQVAQRTKPQSSQKLLWET